MCDDRVSAWGLDVPADQAPQSGPWPRRIRCTIASIPDKTDIAEDAKGAGVMADMFDQINTWLIDRLHEDVDLSDTMAELAQRLVAGGVPVFRMVIGRSMLHPVIGLLDLTWDADTGLVERVQMSRERARQLVDSGSFANTPFGRIASGDESEYVADLSDPETVAEYALFQKLAEVGVTGYAAFQLNFGGGRVDLPYEALMMHGAMLSFCTRRFGGFTGENLEGLRRILPAIFACVRVSTDRQLVNVLLRPISAASQATAC